LDVSCNHVTIDKKINCQCYSSGSSSNVWESLSGIIQDYVDNSIARSNIDFSQVVLQECDNVMIEVDFGSLSALSSQRVMFVSFLDINSLHVYLSNFDSGTKTMVTEDIGNLKISGRLYESSAQMRFFIRNVRINNGDATFDDFYATDTPISLMNVQDVGNFLVTDETSFESVFESEFVRVDRCLTDDGQVSCSKSQLFTDRSGIGSLGLKETVLIIGIVLLVVAIIIGIGIALYIKRWRKKNDLELLGYPPKVPPPRSNTSSGMMSRSANSSGYSVRKQNL